MWSSILVNYRFWNQLTTQSGFSVETDVWLMKLIKNSTRACSDMNYKRNITMRSLWSNSVLSLKTRWLKHAFCTLFHMWCTFVPSCFKIHLENAKAWPWSSQLQEIFLILLPTQHITWGTDNEVWFPFPQSWKQIPLYLPCICNVSHTSHITIQDFF